MNIEKIKTAVNSQLSEDMVRASIIRAIAEDKHAISDILELVKTQTEIKHELINDLNLNLSRAHIFIDSYMPDQPKLKKNESEPNFSKSFVVDEIAKFYLTNQNRIVHLFNRFKSASAQTDV